ncbi:hypothetical protein Aca07nite_35250 [Actinoplanes capillaceus]|uniref:Uncharacterized protein n=1 Tax=Actinoplanes campanulatus TaxID=113559 RepID=A0ABQ3WJ25_9ACTN|nr:hypothetical protein Aca07nite_35250 [Actinoplanes capillaceus]
MISEGTFFVVAGTGFESRELRSVTSRRYATLSPLVPGGDRRRALATVDFHATQITPVIDEVNTERFSAPFIDGWSIGVNR